MLIMEFHNSETGGIQQALTTSEALDAFLLHV